MLGNGVGDMLGNGDIGEGIG